MDRKDQLINSLSKEEREEAWDEVYLEEEGIVLGFNVDTRTGEVRSLQEKE